jgi:putative membrane protein
MMALSLIYELIEWAAALVFGGDLGIAYLGTQGDVWDAHKDMACAAFASLTVILLIAMWNHVLRPHKAQAGVSAH